MAAPFAVGGDPSVNPAEFRVTTFATGLNFPTSMQRLADGSLLVGTSDPVDGGNYFDSTGSLVRLVDADGDGVADGPGSVLYRGLPGAVTSVRQAGSLLFVTSSAAGRERISALRAGAGPSSPYTLVGAINFAFPGGGNWEHTTYALAVRPAPGRAGRYDLFFNVGSFENDADSTATVAVSGLVNGSLHGASIYMVTVLDGGGTPSFSGLTQVATGLRNAAGMAFDPATGALLFEDNGIDGLANVNEPLSADELNRVAAADIGGPIEDFGFAGHYIEYRTGTEVGSGGVGPLAAFQPLPNPSNGSESEGPAEIAMAPAGFPAGLNNGVFIGFHGKFNQGGIANEENPLVFYDLTTRTYFHFVGNGVRIIGHLDGLLSTSDSLFVADLSSTGSLSSASDAGKGVIYQIQAVIPGDGGGDPDDPPVVRPVPVPVPVPAPVPTPTAPTIPTGPARPTAPVDVLQPTPAVPQLTPAVFTGPLVRDVIRLATGRRRTAFLITFSEDMYPALASDPANYVLIAEGRGGGRAIPITSASYDPSTRSVKLVPSRRFELSRRFRLTILASYSTEVSGATGRLLDGDGDGRAGGDFTARFGRSGRI